MLQPDNDINREVQEILNKDEDLHGYNVRATVRDGIVHLQGIVDVLAEKLRAEELVKQISSVVGIENGITISTDGDIDDEAVEFEVQEEINADPRVQLKDVEVVSHGGVVRLKGD